MTRLAAPAIVGPDPLVQIGRACASRGRERAGLFEDAVRRHPDVVRDWLCSRPENLQLYLGWEVEDFHKKAFDDSMASKDMFWLAPRGSGKSTSLGIFKPTWLSIAPPEKWAPELRGKYESGEFWPGAPRDIGPHNIRVAMTSNSAERANSMLWQAKAILTDPRVCAAFDGSLASDSRWKEEAADTRLRTDRQVREATFTALGLGSKQAGGHYDVLVLDDWVTEDNARTEQRRQRLSDFWKFTVKGTQEPWGRRIGCGTRYHPNDWYEEVRDWVKRGLWKRMRVTPALFDGADGEQRSYWPSVYPVSRLLEIREEIGPVAFATQYQNAVDLMFGNFFSREAVERYRKWAEFPEKDRALARTVATCDPGIKDGPRNDFTAFVVASCISPYIHARRCLRGKWTLDQTVEQAKRLWAQYKFDELGVEVVQGQEWLVQALRRECSFRVRPLIPVQFRGKDKPGRANHARTFFDRGQITFEEPSTENGVARLVEEMLSWEPSNRAPGVDDCADAMVWLVLMLTSAKTRLVRMGRRARRV